MAMGAAPGSQWKYDALDVDGRWLLGLPAERLDNVGDRGCADPLGVGGPPPPLATVEPDRELVPEPEEDTSWMVSMGVGTFGKAEA